MFDVVLEPELRFPVPVLNTTVEPELWLAGAEVAPCETECGALACVALRVRAE